MRWSRFAQYAAAHARVLISVEIGQYTGHEIGQSEGVLG